MKLCSNCKYGTNAVSFCTNPERHKPTHHGDCWTSPEDTNSPDPQLTIDYDKYISSIYESGEKHES